MKKLPRIPEGLVESLEEMFPPKDMHFTDNEKKHLWYGGCRNVVKLLREHYDKQHLNILNEEEPLNVFKS